MVREKKTAAKTRKAHDSNDDTPILEWVAGAIGLLLFAMAIFVTLGNGVGQREPPVISVSAEPAKALQGGYRVEFDVINSGDETAASVRVVASLMSAGSVVEEHDISIDFLPPHSSARAGVILQHDPAQLELKIAPSSYQRP